MIVKTAAHTRMTIGGPTLGESQSPRDFRGPTIYGLDEAKAREWIANFLQNLLALWRNSRPSSAIARWGNRGDKDPWWQDTSAFAATTLLQPDGNILKWNTSFGLHCKWEWCWTKSGRCIRHRVENKCQGQREEEGVGSRKLSFMPDDMCTTRNF